MKHLFLGTALLALSACTSITEHDAAMHNSHNHLHAKNCGHTTIAHNDHMDYLHDGHMHHVHDSHADEHVIKVSNAFPANENRANLDMHKDHLHSTADKRHDVVPHGDHLDFLHNGHLHHVHNDHIDEHGVVKT